MLLGASFIAKSTKYETFLAILFCPGYFPAVLAKLHLQNYMSFGCKKTALILSIF